ILAVRKGFQAFGRGTLKFLRPANRKILAYLREYGDEIVLCVANLARSAQPVELDLAKYKGRVPIELIGRTAFPPIGELPYLLTLSGHGFLWFRLAAAENAPAWREELLPREELPVLVLFDGWASLFRDRVVPWRISLSEKVREQLEGEVLPEFIAGRRWYAAKSEPVRRVEIADHVEWKPGDRSWLVALARVQGTSDETQTYFLPLTLAWEDVDEGLVNALGSFTIAKARQQAQVGVLADAFGDETFVRALVTAVGEGVRIKSARGSLHFKPTSAFARLVGTDFAALPVTMPNAQSSNTIVSLGDRMFLKGYRRLQAGVNPEVEIGRYLTDVVQFAHCVPVAGSVEYVAEDGRTATLALVQKYVYNQGSGWDYTLNYLDRFFEDISREATTVTGADVHGGYTALARTLGMRTAELHAAFAQNTGDPAFDPVPLAAPEVAAWTERLRDEATRVLDRLDAMRFRSSRAPMPIACWRSVTSCSRGSRPMPTTTVKASRHVCTGIIIWGRCCSCRTISSLSTSRASHRERWRRGRRSTRRSRTLRACCARSTMRCTPRCSSSSPNARTRAKRSSPPAGSGRRKREGPSSTVTTRSRAPVE
ncbi:MAG: hypothetical protein E6H46_11000, partial [Betaproteobacteria bacterium]